MEKFRAPPDIVLRPVLKRKASIERNFKRKRVNI